MGLTQFTRCIAPCAADDDIVAKLPCWAPPESYAECVASGRYELLSCPAQDPDAGEYHSATVLHVPSKAHRAITQI